MTYEEYILKRLDQRRLDHLKGMLTVEEMKMFERCCIIVSDLGRAEEADDTMLKLHKVLKKKQIAIGYLALVGSMLDLSMYMHQKTHTIDGYENYLLRRGKK
jgi:hypothetical protein